jgi:hypothetical protein
VDSATLTRAASSDIPRRQVQHISPARQASERAPRQAPQPQADLRGRSMPGRQLTDFLSPEQCVAANEAKTNQSRNLHPARALASKGLNAVKKQLGKSQKVLNERHERR